MSTNITVDPRRLQLASDRYRPVYHYLAPANWMNDPNGTIFWKGRYHVFYQYNPEGAYWGTIHWGHASSEDLVHWTDHPIALAPTVGGVDRKGCYSGAAFVNLQGVPTIIYHGVPDGICLATSEDDLLIEWHKHPANPVIANPGPDDEYIINGAPCAWVEGDRYYAITGNSVRSPDKAYLYTSTDLAHWEYLHPFYEGGRWTELGEDCGVPDFFALGNRHVLLFASHSRGAQMYIGNYHDHRFTPEQHKRLSFATTGRPGVYNEGLTLLDAQGRRVMFGRIHESRYAHVQRASGWAGIFALPIVLELSDAGNLLLEPAPEIATLRGKQVQLEKQTVAAGEVLPLGVRGNQLEIRALFDWTDAEEFGLVICASPDGEEETRIAFNINPWQSHPAPSRDELNGFGAPELLLDVTRSSTSPEVRHRDAQRCTFSLAPDEKIELRVFVDRSVVEVFANGQHYLVSRIYPARQDSLEVQIFAVGGSATLLEFDCWEMNAVWPTE